MLAGRRRPVNAQALRSNPRCAVILRAKPSKPMQGSERTRWQKQVETSPALAAVVENSSCATAWWRWPWRLRVRPCWQR
jgi:hypothetical protein